MMYSAGVVRYITIRLEDGSNTIPSQTAKQKKVMRNQFTQLDFLVLKSILTQ